MQNALDRTVRNAAQPAHPPVRTNSGTGVSPVKADRRGFTLIELLVVVSILVILTVFALPAITPSSEKRKIRETARAVNVMLGSARTRAMETGRDCGVIFRRTDGLNQSASTLFLAEVPPPWAGDETGSKVMITGTSATCTVNFTPAGQDPVGDGLVHVGDELQLGYSGHRWRITAISGASWTFSSLSTTLPPVTSTGPMPFRIFRQPVRMASAPMPLPTRAVVDLQWSGVGISTYATVFQPASTTDTSDVAVMFSPRGDVSQVWFSAGVAQATDPIFLLVGRQERVPLSGTTSPAEDGLLNYQDLENLWVSITPQTGMIKTAPVAASTTGVVQSRSIVITGDSMGGN